MSTKNKHNAAKGVDLEKSFYDAANKMNSGKYDAKKNKKKNGLIALFASISALLLCLVCVFLYFGGFVGNATLSGNVTIAGVNVSGMNRKTALSTITKAVETKYANQPLEVTVGSNTVILKPEIANVTLDANKAVTMAFLTRHEGGAFDVSSYLTVNEEAIRKALAPLEEPYIDVTFEESSYKVIGDKPALDEEHVNDPVQQVEIYTGMPSFNYNADDLYAAVLQAYSNNETTAQYTVPTKFPSAVDHATIHNTLYSAPVDAVMDSKTFEVTPHQYGYGLDVAAVEKLLSETPYGETVTVSCIRIAPKNTDQTVGSVLYRDELATYKAVSSSQPYTRDINLKLSCEAINGVVLMPGDVFSYNATLGERTPEKGYKPAAGYMGAEIVQSYGGGICQASSSLYYCAMIADLEIVERHNHGYISAYMPFGMDATVDWAGPDLKIKNTTEYPIRIEAYAEGGTVVVTLMGTDTKDYYVKMDYEVLSVDKYEVKYQEIPVDNNPKGYKDGYVINDPYTGYKIKTYRCRYNKETDELISRDFEVQSGYIKRDKLIAKIVTPAPEPVPVPPAPTPNNNGDLSTGITPDE